MATTTDRRTNADVVLQFVRFAAVGIASTSAHYAMLIALVKRVVISPFSSSAVGFAVGALVNYLLNRRITFPSRKLHLEAASNFCLVAFTGLALNTSMMAVAIRYCKIPYLLRQGAATGAILTCNFSANRWWTCRADSVTAARTR